MSSELGRPTAGEVRIFGRSATGAAQRANVAGFVNLTDFASADVVLAFDVAGIGTDFLDFTVDRNPYKHGRFTPGTHIPIFPPERLAATRPDYILILPWNLKDEIIAQLTADLDWDARFVVPIPEVAVLGKERLVTT